MSPSHFKIFVETSVLISSSILYASDDIEIKLKHHFYDICRPLIGFLGKRIKDRIGLTSLTVESEAKGAILKAVMETLIETLEDEKIEGREKRKVLFDHHVAITDVCLDNLNKNISVLQRDPVSSDEREKYMSEVNEMYDDLRAKADGIDIVKEAEELSDAAPKKLQKLAKTIYIRQLNEDFRPIKRLKDRPAGLIDKEILAEAICLKNYYKCDMYLASTDHHLSPIHLEGGRFSDAIPKEIESRFGIICNWPDMILKMVS